MKPALAKVASKVGSKSNIEDLLTLPTMIFADRSLRRQVRRAVRQEVSTRADMGRGPSMYIHAAVYKVTSSTGHFGDFGPVMAADWGGSGVCPLLLGPGTCSL